MKLLIVTQVIDKNHPILGFFHRWVEEFAKHAEHIHVIALQVGEYNLPENVTVHSLGKKQSQHSNILKNVGMFGGIYAFRFLRIIFQLHRNYDAVFVHMNPESVVLAGWWWRIAGKKVSLWYTHKSVNLKLRIATFFADIVFSASEASFRLKTKKIHIMGHGIDTDFWKPDSITVRGKHWLSVGRLMPSKRHDLAIHAAKKAGVPLRIAGEGSEREKLEKLGQKLGAAVTLLGALSKEELREEYRQAAVLIHTSETGSLDKVVLEALACGTRIQTNDSALKYLENKTAQYVQENHSLQKLIPRLTSLLH